VASAEESERAGGWSALMTAAEKGDLAAATAAIAAGAEVNAADEDGWTALHLAALNDRAAVVELLLAEPGVEVNARTKWKSTPLMVAASRGHLGPVQLLAAHEGIDLDARADYYGRTALIEAARNGHLELVSLLLAKGADVNVADKTGRNTALIESIKNRHDKVTLALLRTGVIDFGDKDMRLNALIWAGNSGSSAIRDALDMTIRDFFERDRRSAAFAG
jgi:ankyrin repeat protein